MAEDALMHFKGPTIHAIPESEIEPKAILNPEGNIVIHVGELVGESLCLPGCWGRTTAQEAQVMLNTAFHCVLKAPLPSWNTSRDTISVWKRTVPVMVMENMYAYVPESERLPQVAAAPCLQHLL